MDETRLVSPPDATVGTSLSPVEDIEYVIEPRTRDLEGLSVERAPDRIEEAKADWAAGRFPRNPGDEAGVAPLPRR